MELCAIASKYVTGHSFFKPKLREAFTEDIRPLEQQRDRIQALAQPRHPYPQPEQFSEPAKNALRTLREMHAPVFERQTGLLGRSFSAEHRHRTAHFMTTQRQLIAESENEILYAQRVHKHAEALQAEIHDAQATGRVIGKKRGRLGKMLEKVKISDAPSLPLLYRQFGQLHTEVTPLINRNSAKPLHLFSTLSADFNNLDRALSLKSQIKFKSDRLVHYGEGSADNLRDDLNELRHISPQAHELADRLESKYAQRAFDKDAQRREKREAATSENELDTVIAIKAEAKRLLKNGTGDIKVLKYKLAELQRTSAISKETASKIERKCIKPAEKKMQQRRIAELKSKIQAEAKHLSATGRGNLQGLYSKIQSLKDPSLESGDLAERLETEYLQPALESFVDELKTKLRTHIQIQFGRCLEPGFPEERIDQILDGYPALRSMKLQIDQVAAVDHALAQRLSDEYTSILNGLPVDTSRPSSIVSHQQAARQLPPERSAAQLIWTQVRQNARPMSGISTDNDLPMIIQNTLHLITNNQL